jgi:hypothetical protein
LASVRRPGGGFCSDFATIGARPPFAHAPFADQPFFRFRTGIDAAAPIFSCTPTGTRAPVVVAHRQISA